MKAIKWRPAAIRDLVGIFRNYAQTAGKNVARRFLAKTEATLSQLATASSIGTLYEPDDPCWSEIRYSPVNRFKRYLVFYRPIPDGIEVIQVLHGARDLHQLLSAEIGVVWNDDAEEDADSET